MGHFKNMFYPLNLIAPTMSILIEIDIFQWTGKMFCVERVSFEIPYKTPKLNCEKCVWNWAFLYTNLQPF